MSKKYKRARLLISPQTVDKLLNLPDDCEVVRADYCVESDSVSVMITGDNPNIPEIAEGCYIHISGYATVHVNEFGVPDKLWWPFLGQEEPPPVRWVGWL